MFDQFFCAGGEDRGVDFAGGYGVDADAEGAEVGGHFSGQGCEGGFAGCIGGAGEGVDAAAGDAGDIHNRAMGMGQFFHQAAGEPDGGEEIYLEDLPPEGFAGGECVEAGAALRIGVRPFGRDGGVVHQGMEFGFAIGIAREAFAHVLDGAFGVVGIGEIDLDVIFGTGGPWAIFGEGVA